MNTIMQWRKYPDFKPEEETLYLVMATCMPTSHVRLEDAYELAEYDKKDGWILEAWPMCDNVKVSYQELAEAIFSVMDRDISDLFCDGKAGCIDKDGEVIRCEDEDIKACITRWLRTPADKKGM